MAKKWIKLHRKLLFSKELNMAANENGLAERLFYRMLLAADDYGRLPGDPWLLKAHTGPLLNNSEGEVAAAISCLEEHGLIARYKAGGEDYLVLVNYDRYQTTDWSKVGESEFPAPPDWQTNPPISLVEFLEKHPDRRYFSLKRYGLTSEVNLCGQPLMELEGSLEVEVEGEVEVEEGTTKARADTDAPPKEKKLTPIQQVIEDAWAAFEFEGKPSGKGYSGLVDAVQKVGIPLVRDWAAIIKRKPPPLKEGADRWKSFCKQFKDAMNRPWEWQPKSNKSGKTIPARKDAKYGKGRIQL